MAEQPGSFRIIFEKMAELTQEATPQESAWTDQVDMNEYDEIRALRQIVMEVQDKPRVYFATT